MTTTRMGLGGTDATNAAGKVPEGTTTSRLWSWAAMRRSPAIDTSRNLLLLLRYWPLLLRLPQVGSPGSHRGRDVPASPSVPGERLLKGSWLPEETEV